MILITLMSIISTPSWIDHPPISADSIYMVGEGESFSKEDALQKAWNSALIRIGISEFPELNQLSAKSTETLTTAEFERTSIQNFQLISWKGIHELKSYNSPFASFDPSTKTYHVYRLLEWSKTALQTSQLEVSKSIEKFKKSSDATIPTYKFPTSPEEQQKEEKKLSKQMEYLNARNSKLETRDNYIRNILMHLHCGTRVFDLTHMLGEPDSYEWSGSEFRFTWGTYYVYSDMQGYTFPTAKAARAYQIVRTNVKAYAEDLGRGTEIQLCKH